MLHILVNGRPLHISRERFKTKRALKWALKRDGITETNFHWYVAFGKNHYKIYYYDDIHIPKISLFLEFMEGVPIPVQNYLK